MNALLNLVRRRVGFPDPDGALLDRYLAAHDDTAFVELVRRHGPLVWGACRRHLPNPADADDAFQAVWLVLVRRADKLAGRAALGPWLFQVAVWTARNLRRRNAHRLARTAPPVDLPDPAPSVADLRLDLDAALLALPEKYRTPVVLCHLQGWTRRDAAAHLGCPEGTLSALLARALVKLRKQLGTDPTLLLAAACVTVPASLASAAVRTASLSAAGVAPAVADLTRGVLRMFWVKKVVAAGMVFAAVLGTGLGVGLLGGPDRAVAQAPPAKKSDDLMNRIKKLEDELLQLRKQAEAERKLELMRAAEAELLAKVREDLLAKSREARRQESFIEVMARPLGSGLMFAVVEYSKGKPVGLVGAENVETLRVLLARAYKDPAGPRKLFVTVEAKYPADKAKAILDAGKAAGFTSIAYTGPGATDLEGTTLRLGERTAEGAATRLGEALTQLGRATAKPRYYLEFNSGDKVEVVSFPLTGTETVVDAIGNVAGLGDKAKSGHVYIARDGKVMVVDWVGISERGMTQTNYQLQAGDRLRVEAPPRVPGAGR